jgi:hypothetical protein
LQQHNHDDEETDQDVDSGNEVDHKFNVFLSSTANRPESHIRSHFRRQVYGAEGGI